MMPDLLNGPWHVMILWAVAPAALMLIFALGIRVSRYETPHFLAMQGRYSDLMDIMHIIAELNNKRDVLKSSVCMHQAKTDEVGFLHAVGLLTNSSHVVHTVLLSFMFFTKGFVAFGLTLFWPLAWRAVSDETGIGNAAKVVLTAVLGIPGIVLAMLLIYLLPRRVSACIGSGMMCCSAFLVRYLFTTDIVGLVGVFLLKLFLPTLWMTVLVLPSEMYPTEVRVWAYALLGTMSKMGGLVAPIFVECSKRGFLWTLFAMALAVSVAIWELPETKDVQLSSCDTVDDTPAELNLKRCEINKGVVDYGTLKNKCTISDVSILSALCNRPSET